MRKFLQALRRLHLTHTASVLSWLARRMGRRGAFLLFLTVLDTVYAYSLTFTTPGHPENVAWAVVWALAGVNAASGILIRRDRIQYALASGTKTAWALYQLQLWFSGQLPRGWLAAVIWLAFAATVLLVASWPEDPRPENEAGTTP